MGLPGFFDAGLLVAEMKLNQWKSTEELEQIQEEKLKALLSYAKENVPHYRDIKQVKGLEDLSQLPMTDKYDVRRNPDSFLSRLCAKSSLLHSVTSGSTGTPLTIYRNHDESKYGRAFQMHHLIEGGVTPFDTQAWITTDPYMPNILNRMGFYRRRHLIFHGTKQLLDDLISLKPDALRGTPSFLVPLAHENIDRGHELSVKRAFCFSEMVSDKARKLITDSFGCPLYDSYGSVETSWISWECEKGNMHLHSDHLIAEIVDNHGQPVSRGDYGNIVITPLWQRTMPLIRYKLGDRTAFGPKCSCGRGLHTLKSIEGRANNLVALPSGELCSSHLITFNLRAIPGILQFQAIQEKDHSINVMILPVGEPSQALKEKIIESLNQAFPERVPVNVEFVKEFKPDKRGKLMDFISRHSV